MKITIGIILFLVTIALYIFWLLRNNREEGAKSKDVGDAQEFDIMVKGAYSPNILTAKVNKKVRINFLRQESTDCSRYVTFDDFKIRRELPENETVSIEFIPTKKGTYHFACDMGMYQGKLIVE